MLKPDGHVVFIDFGIARTAQRRETATRVITTGYSPPEQYFGKPEFRSDLIFFRRYHVASSYRCKAKAAFKLLAQKNQC